MSLVITRPFLQFTQQFCHFLIFEGVSNITVRVRLEGSRINNALIIHRLIFLYLVGCLDGAQFAVTDDVMGLDDAGLACPLFQGILDLDVIQDVLMQNLTTHLTGPFTVEGQTAHFALLFTFGGDKAVAFGNPQSKFNDVVTIAQLIFEVPEEIAKKRFGQTRTMDVDNTVHTTKHHTFF